MDIELIDHEMPLLGRWVRCDRLCDVLDEILLGAGGTPGGSDDLAAGDIEVDDEAERAMPAVFELAPFDLARLHGQGRMLAF